MNAVIHTYDEVYTCNITLYSDGNCKKRDLVMYHYRDVINKMACINLSCGNLPTELFCETSNTSFAPGSSLYVASECKTGRDTFRNSGYSITRSPEKADAIVVPDVRAEYYYCHSCNMVGYNSGNKYLYLINIEKPGYLITQLTDEDLNHVRKFLANENIEADDIQRAKIDVWFLPKCDELKDVLQGKKLQNIPYIQESKVPIKASTQFTPETLVFWENIDDKNLLVRTICTSDWMDYPVTLLTFLTCFKKETNWYNYANGDFRRILKSIGYESYYDPRYNLDDDRSITPKDYEMLQSYILYKLGLEATGGFVSATQFEKIVPDALQKFMRRAVALKPLDIPVRMKLGQIANLTGA